MNNPSPPAPTATLIRQLVLHRTPERRRWIKDAAGGGTPMKKKNPSPFKGQAGKNNPFKTRQGHPHRRKEDDHYDHLQRMERHGQWRREHAVELAIFYVKREYDLS